MLLRLLVAASFTGVSVAGASASAQQCSPRGTGRQIFRPKQTCGLVTGLESSPDYRPWTHEPHCSTAKSTNNDGEEKKFSKFCVYTKSSEKTGRGLSIITTPAIAKAMSERILFRVFDESPRPSENSNYEWRQLPGRGIGLIATRNIQAGEIILKDLPSILLERHAKELLRTNDLVRMLWRGILQLPKAEQNKSRCLAVSAGLDLIEDIMHTNGVGLVLREDEENAALFPELSVCHCPL